MSGILVRRHWFTFVLICLLGVALVVACGGNDEPQYGHQVILNGTAVLACSQECQDRGQCGLAEATQTQVVLIGSGERPTMRPRQFALPVGSQVAINGQPQTINLILATNANTRETAYFYSVTIPDRQNQNGWVAGWCLTAPAQ